MADWLKVNHTLLRSPKLRALRRELGCKKHAALGLAINWLIFVDEQTTDGNTHLCVDDVDDELGVEGAVHALLAIGWAEIDDDGNVCAVDFGKHCGETAKKRAINARRVSKCKNRENPQENEFLVMKKHYQGNEKTLPEVMKKHYQSYEKKLPCGNEKTLAEKKRKEENNIKDILCVPNNNTVVMSGDAAPTSARTSKPTPISADEVCRFMANQALCGLKGADLEACAAGFFDDMEACGWTARNGAPLYDWQAAARKYLRSWQTRAASNAIAARKAATPTVYRSETNPDYSL